MHPSAAVLRSSITVLIAGSYLIVVGVMAQLVSGHQVRTRAGSLRQCRHPASAVEFPDGDNNSFTLGARPCEAHRIFQLVVLTSGIVAIQRAQMRDRRYTPRVDFAAAKLVLEAFEREGVRDAVVGAAALNLHGRSSR